MSNKDNNNAGKILLRIVLSPLIFIWGLLLITAGTVLLFPLGFLVVYSIAGFIATPLIWLLQISGARIGYLEPYVNSNSDIFSNRNVLRGHFLGATIHIWGAFALVYIYIKTGEIVIG